MEDNKDFKIRDLTPEEIEVKIASVNKTGKGLQLLLYKTARVDSQLLDETFGSMNWKCDYKEIKGNMYCGISVYNKEIKDWITKWDCGVESAFGDKEKGEASDAFKRAGFKWGIGVELYTPIFIYIFENNCQIKYDDNHKKYVCNDKFEVSKIEIKNKKITKLEIINKSLNDKVVFTYNANSKQTKTETPKLKDTKQENTLITKEQLESLNKAIDLYKFNDTEVSKILEQFQYTTTNEIKSKDYESICLAFKSLKDSK